jgi:hypothetical protein
MHALAVNPQIEDEETAVVMGATKIVMSIISSVLSEIQDWATVMVAAAAAVVVATVASSRWITGPVALRRLLFRHLFSWTGRHLLLNYANTQRIMMCVPDHPRVMIPPKPLFIINK